MRISDIFYTIMFIIIVVRASERTPKLKSIIETTAFRTLIIRPSIRIERIDLRRY